MTPSERSASHTVPMPPSASIRCRRRWSDAIARPLASHAGQRFGRHAHRRLQGLAGPLERTKCRAGPAALQAADVDRSTQPARSRTRRRGLGNRLQEPAPASDLGGASLEQRAMNEPPWWTRALSQWKDAVRYEKRTTAKASKMCRQHTRTAIPAKGCRL